jgi:hypothetical protein
MDLEATKGLLVKGLMIYGGYDTIDGLWSNRLVLIRF